MSTSQLTFQKGMNTDIDKAFRDGSTYLDAVNFTFTSQDGGTVGALETVKGNELVTDIAIPAGQQIVGYCNVVENTVYFTSDGTNSSIFYYEPTKPSDRFTQVYSDIGQAPEDRLNFSIGRANRVVAVGRKETEDIHKVYWVDGINELRYANLYEYYGSKTADVFSAIQSNDMLVNYEYDIIPGSGTYENGVVYYAHQPYSVNGASGTIYSHPLPTKLSPYSTIKDGGGDKNESSGCSVRVTVNAISDDLVNQYDRVRIYSIFYNAVGSPVINIVAERPLNTNSVSVIDYGSSIGTIELDEFLSKNQTSYIPEAIESKDNTLFIGNLTEATFQSDAIDAWDSRAYRFGGSGTYTYVDSADGLYTVRIDGANGTNPFKVSASGSTYPGATPGKDVPEEFDCVNKYNDVYGNSLRRRVSYAAGGYRYIGDGSAIGGEGQNVRFEFSEIGQEIDKVGLGNLREDNPVIHEQSDEYSYGNVIECEDGEVYRVGIKFYNKQGQSSFVKWIADILWEEAYALDVFGGKGGNFSSGYTDLDGTENTGYKTSLWGLSSEDDKVTSKAKVLTVTLKNMDIFTQDPSIAYWQVVRAKRTDLDRTSIGNGGLFPAILTSVDGEAFYGPKLSTLHNIRDLYTFASPDLMFNNPDEVSLDNLKFRIYNKYTCDIDSFDDEDFSSVFRSSVFKPCNLQALSSDDSNGGSSGFDNLIGVSDYKFFKPAYGQDGIGESPTQVGPYSYLNQYRFGYSATNYRIAGAHSAFAVYLEDYPSCYELGRGTVSGFYEYYYASLIRNNTNTRYGGSSYADRANTEYIPFSDINDTVGAPGSPANTVWCRYGDTYTKMFQYMHHYFTDDVDKVYPTRDGSQSMAMIPVQSKFDLRKRNDRIQDYYVGLDKIATEWDDSMFIAETVLDGIKFQPDKYDQSIGDLYTGNTAYLSEPIHTTTYSKSYDFTGDSINKTKVLASEKKINNEKEDSWLSFLTNNFIEVDNAKGDLNTLKVIDSKLFFWQDKGFGTLAVNDRSLISDSAGAQLSLGTGGVLERYDYISNQVGNLDKYNVVASEGALFWTYSANGRIYMYDNQLKEISTSAGIGSRMVNTGGIVDPITICDFTNNETLFKVGFDVYVYDWQTGSFTGTYSFQPFWFISDYSGNYSSSYDGMAVYSHNSDSVDRAEFYESGNHCSIKHICSEYHAETKVFDSIQWYSESDTGFDKNYNDTFDEFRFYNDYQNTDWQSLSPARKERMFSVAIPRDRVNLPEGEPRNIFTDLSTETIPFGRRIRDKYIIIDLKYNNINNAVFSVPYILLTHRKSTR